MPCRILILDIETAPLSAYVWSLWKEARSTEFINNDWFMLSWAAKWYGDKKCMSDSLANYGKDFVKREDDTPILSSLVALLDEADIVVAHNGKAFDIPKINTRLIMNGILPPSPYKMVDTLKVLKKNFKFTSNRLDFVAQQLLGVGKDAHKEFSGFELWRACLNGDKKAWKEMVKYNEKDVEILEGVYARLLPWIDSHPNVALINGDTNELHCRNCGSGHINFRGYAYTGVGKYRRYVCRECGGWGRERFTELSREESRGVLTSVSIL